MKKCNFKENHKQCGLMLALLFISLVLLFGNSFLPGKVLFNNDMPLGFVKPYADAGLSDFIGRWNDRNYLGTPEGAPLPDVYSGLLHLLGPVGFEKFYEPLSLLFVGLCAWIFFRALELESFACILGGIAAALNSDFLATSCWGVASQTFAFGCCYLAMAAIVTKKGNIGTRGFALNMCIVGLTIGLNVIFALDIGAIFSIVVAAFLMYFLLFLLQWEEKHSWTSRIFFACSVTLFVSVCAFFIAIGTIQSNYNTQIEGIVGAQKEAKAQQSHWDWATQWSLPKKEVLSLIAPGVFGLRMDSSQQEGVKGGDYWGEIGQSADWQKYFEEGEVGPRPNGFIRYGGGAGYPGMLVLVVAGWAIYQSFRKDSIFTPAGKKLVRFCAGGAVVCILLAFGRYAPFYHYFYLLPYASTIRNPTKFIHVFEWLIVILFAYGVHGMLKQYRLKLTRRPWMFLCTGMVAISTVIIVGVYNSMLSQLEEHLQHILFTAEQAHDIANFSFSHVCWACTWLLIACFLVFDVNIENRGKYWRYVMALVLVVDLVSFDRHWVIYQDYSKKYQSNPVVEWLKDNPQHYRAACLPSCFADSNFSQKYGGNQQLAANEQLLHALYNTEWLQHLFPYYGIQSLDIVQMSRVPIVIQNFENAFGRGNEIHQVFQSLFNKWKITGTRYIIGSTAWLNFLNQLAGTNMFGVAVQFDLVSKDGGPAHSLEDITAVLSDHGAFAVFEYIGALPRAALYSHWVLASKEQSLRVVNAPTFDPLDTVLVSNTIQSVPHEGSFKSVQFTRYTPSDIVIKADAGTNDAVLLMNTIYDKDWKVYVDGVQKDVLSCNYIMQGVLVPQGIHTVEFKYRPPLTGLLMFLTGLIILIFDVYAIRRYWNNY